MGTTCDILTNRDRSDASSTCSLKSDALRFPTEHGRQYHAYNPGRYHRPNDEESSQDPRKVTFVLLVFRRNLSDSILCISYGK